MLQGDHCRVRLFLLDSAAIKSKIPRFASILFECSLLLGHFGHRNSSFAQILAGPLLLPQIFSLEEAPGTLLAPYELDTFSL